MNTIKIKYPKKRKPQIYEIETGKMLFILSKLENKKVEFQNINQIQKLMKKYRLFDKIFLENISKL